jgi:hypothetical protein
MRRNDLGPLLEIHLLGEDMMRATWVTSLIAGMLFGYVARLVDTANLQGVYAVIIFYISVLFAVLGVPQIREIYAEQRRRGSVRVRKEDFPAFYLPAWGRMFVWFVACAISAFTIKAFGL